MIVLPRQHKHFFHRAGFGIGLQELQSDASISLKQLVEETVHSASQPLPLIHRAEFGSPEVNQSLFLQETQPRLQRMESMSTQLDRVRASWFDRMTKDHSILREKMTLFWHGHFACQCTSEITAAPYLDVLRRNALGNFRTLLHEVAKTPAMILFLNNQQNRKDQPNENFARELMELFTMGRGSYTERDIKESARAFTGWSTDNQGHFIFRESHHDAGFKTFLDKRGRLQGEDIIEYILQQKQTPLFIASKIYHYFVNEKTDQEAIEKIAQQISYHQYDLAEVMNFVFNSDFFYREVNLGSRVKSPIELLVQVSKLFGIEYLESSELAFLQKALGQLLFEPPNVAGWQGGRAWINNSTLMLRLNLVRYLIHQERFDYSVSTPLEAMAAGDTIQIIQVNKDFSLLLEMFSGTRYQDLEEKIKRALLSTETAPKIARKKDFKDLEVTMNLILRTVSLPEFQMC